jgi:hypothetical protein
MQLVVCSSASTDFIYKNGYYGQLSVHKDKELCVKACVRLVVHLLLRPAEH